MSLASRLVLGGLASEDEVEGALREQLTTGKRPFLQSLMQRSPSVTRALGGALPGADENLDIDAGLAARVPPGASAVLLAAPIGRDAESGVVLVAAVDPLDRHVATELEFHIGEPIRLVPASLDALLAALAADARSTSDVGVAKPAASVPVPVPLQAGPAPPVPKRGTPVHGTPAIGVSRSAPAIPLVRVTPGSSSLPAPVIPRAARLPSEIVDDEPVLPLTRSRPPTDALSAADIEGALEGVRAASTPDAVVASLVAALIHGATAVVAFAVRGSVFRGRESAGAIDAERARAVEVSMERPSILHTACEIGHYVGPIPITEIHGDLAELLGEHGGEVAVHAVIVAGRPASVIVVGGMQNVYAATARAERLVREAGKVLESLVRARKR